MFVFESVQKETDSGVEKRDEFFQHKTSLGDPMAGLDSGHVFRAVQEN